MTGNTKTPSKLKVAFIAENVAPGILANDGGVAVAEYFGLTVVYQGAPIAVLGTTNYAPYAQAIIASGANVAFETLDGTDGVGLAAALKSAGYKGIIVNGVTYLPGTLGSQPSEAAAVNGVYVLDEFADENKTPAVAQAKKDLVAVGEEPYLTTGVSEGYWSAIVFEQMLRARPQVRRWQPGQGSRRNSSGGGQSLHLYGPHRWRHRYGVLSCRTDHSNRLRHPTQDRRDLV